VGKNLASDDTTFVPADNHVHSQWSWDAANGDMGRSCARAVELGLRSIAFTEHADWVRGDAAVFDAEGYLESIERCRAAYPGLRILSGIEMGEPHWYPDRAQAMLTAGFDRVLASMHCIEWQGTTADAAHRGFLTPDAAHDMFRSYLGETLAMIGTAVPFQVLAHADYPKRYWPEKPPFDVTQYEVEFRPVLRAAAERGVALEVNTTRGRDPERFLCPGPVVLGWWREEGGEAISFGSDAHSPEHVAAGFQLAQEMASANGFRQTDDPSAFWTAVSKPL
jgi:histidinol-phosphatase (PHP family)